MEQHVKGIERRVGPESELGMRPLVRFTKCGKVRVASENDELHDVMSATDDEDFGHSVYSGISEDGEVPSNVVRGTCTCGKDRRSREGRQIHGGNTEDRHTAANRSGKR